ncbi:MAG: hypothetical protein K2Y51_17685 [Gammaproteobacteria bacterium]|nr:hypothetical protein [Gammaproteobacteria bacterium]
MGFKEVVAEGAIQAKFTSITVFEARGITVADRLAETTTGQAAGVEYRIAISASVNAACRLLFADDFAESEEEWCKEVKSTGPFALVAVGPTAMVSCAEGRSMRAQDGSIITYDCFPQVREELHAMEKRVLPPVVSALTCAFNAPNQYVCFKRLARAAVGITPDLGTVRDIRVEFRAEGYVSRAVDAESMSAALRVVSERASRLNKRAADFFALGVEEVDQLKRFLCFFLSLEIETHAVFGRTRHRSFLEAAVTERQSSRTSTIALLERQVSSLGNLLDRFAWCAASSWPHLVDDDVEMFKRLKEARDQIAHGRASEPPQGYARNAELLAHKVLWQ